MSLILASNAREHAIAAETNAVEAAGKALAQAQWRLDERVVNAPASGIVADTFAEPGETVNAGASVVEILPPENILVRFFVPEAELVGVHVGDGVKVTCDSCPTDLTAKISFVATQSEYAPPVIYAQGTRGALVYLIEARPEPARATLLKPGQPVEVFPLGTRTP
jgi:HlyD family secretion protein